METAKQTSTVLDQFTSLIGIRRTDTSLYAIGRKLSDNKDYLVRYFRVKKEYYEMTLAHFQTSQQISHPNVHKILDVISSESSSEFCVLYQSGYILFERIDSQNYLTEDELGELLRQVQEGLQAQKDILGSENNFLDEWNIFQLNSSFKIGISLPKSSSELLIPLKSDLNYVVCDSYHLISVESHDNAIGKKNFDSISLGVTALRATGFDDIAEAVLRLLSESTPNSVEEELWKICGSPNDQRLVKIVSFLLEPEKKSIQEKPETEEFDFEWKSDENRSVTLAYFDTIFNGKAVEPGPHTSGHQDTVYSVRLSGNRKYLVSGSADCSLKLFDFQNRKLMHTFHNAHKDAVLTVAVSYEGEVVASGSRDKSLKVYSSSSYKALIIKPNYHIGPISTLAFTKNGRYLVSGSSDQTIKILDIENPEAERNFGVVHDDSITCLVLINNDSTIVSVSLDQTVRFFDFRTGKCTKVLRYLHSRAMPSIAANSQFIATGSSDRSICVCSVKTHRLVAKFTEVHNSSPRALCITPDSKFVISGSRERNIKVFSLFARTITHVFNAHVEPIYDLCCSINNEHIVSCSVDCTVRVFNLNTWKQEDVFEIRPNCKTPALSIENKLIITTDSVGSMLISPNNKYIITGAGDFGIRIFDLETRQLLHTFENAHQDWVMGLCISSDSKYLASTSPDKRVIKWDLENMKQMNLIADAHEEWILCMLITPDNQYIITGSRDRSIKMFNFSSLGLFETFEEVHEGSIRTLAISTDSEYLASGADDCSVNLYSLSSFALLYTLPNAHTQPIKSLGISVANKYLVSGSKDGTIRVFNLLEGSSRCKFGAAHTHSVKSLVLSADGRYIISGSFDHSIGLFDIETKTTVRKFQDAHQDWIECVAISSQGSFVASGSSDGMIKIHRFTG